MEELVAYLIGLALILVIGKILVLPFKLIKKLLLNGIIGGATLFIFNVLGIIIGFNPIPITWLSSLVAGILGIPGVILLIVL